LATEREKKDMEFTDALLKNTNVITFNCGAKRTPWLGDDVQLKDADEEL
jgi:hypothetical protein